MRIGLVNEYFPPFVVGGAELSTLQLARSLAQKGHFVSVLTPNYGAPKEETEEGIQIFRFWFPQRLRRGELARSRYLDNPLYPLYLAGRIFLWGRRIGCDLFHAQNTHSLIGTFLAARLLRKRVVFSVRDFTVSDPPPIPESTCRLWIPFIHLLKKGVHRLNAKWRRATLSRVDEVVFVSHFLKGYFLGKGLQFRGHVHVIYNLPPELNLSPVAIEKIRSQWGFPGSAKIVLFGGRRSPGKGMQTLLEVIPKVRHRFPRAHFVLAGRDTDSGISQAFSQLEGVTLLGHLPNPAFLDLIRASDVVIAPSVWKEPLSRLLLEAMSFGKPVVATDTGGTPELVVHGENGFLVASEDPAAFSGKVVELLENEILSQDMGRRGQALLRERFSVPRLIHAWERIYKVDGHPLDDRNRS